VNRLGVLTSSRPSGLFHIMVGALPGAHNSQRCLAVRRLRVSHEMKIVASRLRGEHGGVTAAYGTFPIPALVK
jgi:hypothetical protein